VGKPLKFASRKAVPMEHPSGGVFNLRPFDSDKALDWYDLAQDFTALKTRESEQYRRMAKYVSEEIVDSIENVVDAESGAVLEMTPEIQLAILMEMSDHEVAVPVFETEENGDLKMVDGKPVQKVEEGGALVFMTKPANEPYFVWAMTKAGELWQQRSAAAKNS
jgi:hypothetical protein